MQGIILAGGASTRLYPLTMVTSKQLLFVYDKPMIYYPLSTLMLAGIKDILIISTPVDTLRFESLLGDGSQFGINLSYKVQSSPDGFILGEEFFAGEAGAMVLGDNIFYGNGFSKILKAAGEDAEVNGRATVFGDYVPDPERFGVVAFDENGQATSIEEKSANPKSNYVVTGLYFYPASVDKKAKEVKPSARGELEITTLNEMYLNEGKLDVQLLGRGFAWFDTGTMDSLVEAADFVQMIEKRQGIKLSAPEKIAFLYGWIDKEGLLKTAEKYGKSPYGQLGHDVMNELFKRGHEGVGSDIAEAYAGVAEGSPVTTMPYTTLDITNKETVEKVITEVQPDAVIHCAAWTAVDMAEDDDKVDAVRRVNVGGTQNIADACKKIDCKMLYLSTDYVFDGQGTEPWKPDCKDYKPLNVYGYISWYDFCVEFHKQYGLTTKVIPVTTEEYGLSKAKRPVNSRLDKSKFVEAGFAPPPTWQDAMSRYLKEAKL